MGLKLAMTLMPVKPPLPIDTGNQRWGYLPTVQTEGLLKDHCLLSTVTIKGSPMVSPQPVETSLLKVKMAEKCTCHKFAASR